MTHHTKTHSPYRRRFLVVLTTLAAFLLSFVLVPQAAYAATVATIDSVSFTNDSFQGGTYQEIDVAWSAPDDPSTPLTVEIPLPAELHGQPAVFNMTDAAGDVIGTCTVAKTTANCVVDDAYVTANPLNITGSFKFMVKVETYNSKTLTPEFDFGGVTAPPVTITPDPRVCVTDCEYKGYRTGAKYGAYDALTETIKWVVNPMTPATGIPAGSDVTVTDNLDPAVFEVIGDPIVYEARTTRIDPRTGRYTAVLAVKTTGVTVSADKLTVSFESVAGLPDDSPLAGDKGLTGSAYQVVWQVKVLDEGAAGHYTNNAEWTIEGYESGNVSGTSTRQGGSATGVGTNEGKLIVKKSVVGDVEFQTAPEFTLNWIAYADASDTVGTPGSATINPDGTYESPKYLAGTRVVLTEVIPTDTSSVHWATPKFIPTDAAGAPIEGAEPTDSLEITFSTSNNNLGKISYFGLTNEATLQQAPFEASKKIVNADDVDLSGITEYTLNYSYPEGDAWPAGSGELVLPADGTVVQSAPLPIGAVLTLSEATPSAVTGAEWGIPVISPETLTISEDDTVMIEVTNTITRDVGAFSVKKSLTGIATGLVSQEATFTVKWSYPAGVGYEADSGEAIVTADGDPVLVSGIPAGAVVSLVEETPTPVEGADWEAPIFSQSTFTINQGEVVSIELENPITLGSGGFQIRKLLDGTGADLIAPDTAFEVEYSYPGGIGFEAGSGSISVLPDGEWVQSDPLPYGAEVTLEEVTPAAVSGGVWESQKFSTSIFTVGDDTVVDITLTNTITKDIEPGQPTTKPGLATTGGAPLLAWSLSALLLLAAGAGALLLGKRVKGRTDK